MFNGEGMKDGQAMGADEGSIRRAQRRSSTGRPLTHAAGTTMPQPHRMKSERLYLAALAGACPVTTPTHHRPRATTAVVFARAAPCA